jgi:hypothetical protein
METFVWERTEKDMDRAVSGVVRKCVSLRGAGGLSKIPYSTLKDRMNLTKSHNALRNEMKTKFAGHSRGNVGKNKIWLPV